MACKLWTEEEKKYLHEETKGKSYKQIVSEMQEKFNIRTYTVDNVRTACYRLRIQTGAKCKPIGSERIDPKGFVVIKVANPNKWKRKNIYMWEKYHGEVPKGYLVGFKDGNNLNCDIDNLELITVSECRRDKMQKFKQRQKEKGIIWTDKELNYIRSCEGKTYKEIAEELQEKFNYRKYTRDTVKEICKKNGIEYKGGRVVKFDGVPIGSEFVGKEGNLMIKVEHNKWVQKRRFIWELYNGEIPAKHCVINADGDKSNCDIDNLILIDKGDVANMSRLKYRSNNPEITRTGANILKLRRVIKEIEEK